MEKNIKKISTFENNESLDGNKFEYEICMRHALRKITHMITKFGHEEFFDG